MLSKLNPKNVFLIDGIGAGLTVAFLMLLVARFEDLFGMPQDIIGHLAIIGSLFACYSLLMFFLKPKKWRPLLTLIIGANIAYCVLTIVLMIMNSATMTYLGYAYFIGEIIIVLVLVAIEIKILNRSEVKQK